MKSLISSFLLLLLTPALSTSLPSPPFLHNNNNNINQTLLPREQPSILSGLDIVIYAARNCMGGGQKFKNVQYNPNLPQPLQYFHSYSLSRDLTPIEQLDFSGAPNGKAQTAGHGRRDADTQHECAVFAQTAADAGKKAGCHGVGNGAKCFRLWAH